MQQPRKMSLDLGQWDSSRAAGGGGACREGPQAWGSGHFSGHPWEVYPGAKCLGTLQTVCKDSLAPAPAWVAWHFYHFKDVIATQEAAEWLLVGSSDIRHLPCMVKPWLRFRDKSHDPLGTSVIQPRPWLGHAGAPSWKRKEKLLKDNSPPAHLSPNSFQSENFHASRTNCY